MSDLAAGVRYLVRGQRWVLRHRRLYVFCLFPALIALVLYLAALVLLALWVGDFAAWATPFADGWSAGWQATVRTALAVLVLLGGVFAAILTFTAVTLLIGDPFYESLSEKVEESEGGAPDGPEESFLRELWISVTDSVYVLVRALLIALPLLLLGFVPVIGQTVVPALGFAVSGFFLTLELTSVAMRRRGVDVRARLAVLRRRKGIAVGLGAPLVVSFLVPLAAVFLMPGAVAGATLLVRDLYAEPGEEGIESAEEGPEPGVSPRSAKSPHEADG